MQKENLLLNCFYLFAPASYINILFISYTSMRPDGHFGIKPHETKEWMYFLMTVILPFNTSSYLLQLNLSQFLIGSHPYAWLFILCAFCFFCWVTLFIHSHFSASQWPNWRTACDRLIFYSLRCLKNPWLEMWLRPHLVCSASRSLS